MKPITSTMSIGDTVIHYWTYGDDKKKQKPSIVFIHGFTGSHEGFQYILPHLVKHYRVVVPDLPGFGDSTIHNGEWKLDDIAKNLNQFVTNLGCKTPPYLASHSMGGLVAATMLAQSPKLYHKKTVFVSPAAERIPRADVRNIGAWLSSVQYFIGKTIPVVGPKLVRSKLLSRIGTALIMTSPDRALRKNIYQHHFKNLRYISSVAFYYQLHREITHTGAIDYAKRLKPFDVLLISGAKDNVTPLVSQRRFQQAVGARLRVIPGVGHLAHYETPTVIAEAMHEFLSS